jgi:DNA-binding MarR family transcriptional regulator
MTMDNIIYELNEIKTSISEMKNFSFYYKNTIKNEYESKIFLQNYIKNRKLRSKSINATLFLNPSWDILVELCYARLVGKTESVSSIVRAGGAPPTTGLRHLGCLQKMGYIERENQKNDKRRVLITISDKAFNLMSSFFVRTSQN